MKGALTVVLEESDEMHQQFWRLFSRTIWKRYNANW